MFFLLSTNSIKRTINNNEFILLTSVVCELQLLLKTHLTVALGDVGTAVVSEIV